jgi:hypothetical protein
MVMNLWARDRSKDGILKCTPAVEGDIKVAKLSMIK